jgi:hypothetical protein
MNVRFHHEPWDEATETEFIGGMGAILAGYLRDVASGPNDAVPPDAAPLPEGPTKRSRRRVDGARTTTSEVRHG